MIGPAVKEISTQFDLYWNSRASIGISDLLSTRDAEAGLVALRASSAGHEERVETVLTAGFRSAALGHAFDWGALAFSAAVTLAFLVFAALTFRRMEKHFADLV